MGALMRAPWWGRARKSSGLGGGGGPRLSLASKLGERKVRVRVQEGRIYRNSVPGTGRAALARLRRKQAFLSFTVGSAGAKLNNGDLPASPPSRGRVWTS